jgi:hypothetical protein
MKKLIATIALSVIGLWGQSSGNNTVLLFNTPPPSGPQQVFVTTTGTQGSATWCYWVVAVYNIGMSIPGGPACTNVANATLTSGNYNTVTWNPPPGANPTGYWVIANTSTQFPGTGTDSLTTTVISSSTFSENDQSNTKNSFTYASAPWATGQILIDNQNYGVPVVKLEDGVGNVDVQWYQLAVVPPATTLSWGPVWSADGNVSAAGLASGVTLQPALAGRQFKVIGGLFQAVGGTAATCTAVVVEDTSTAPNIVESIPAATLTSGTWIGESGANITFTHFLTPLPVGQGLVLISTGSTCTTMTSLNYRILYRFL